MRRLGAALAAVVMVLLAIYVRGRIDDGGRGNGGRGGEQVTRLRCATELTAACEQLSEDDGDGDVDVTIEGAGATAEALASVPDDELGTVGFDAWLVPSPWPEIVDVRRQVNGLAPAFGAPSPTIARSPLVLVVRSNRQPVLEATPECGGPPGWRCVGDLAGRPWDTVGGETQWGRVKPGHGDPTQSATGLFALSQATSAFLGTGEDYSLGDLRGNDDYGDWLSNLERSIPSFSPPNGTPFLQMLQLLPTAAYDVVGTTEAEAGPAIANAARDHRRRLTLLYASPMVTADVVLAPVVGSDIEAVAALAGSNGLRTALAEKGWRVPGEPRARGVPGRPALRATSGLPDAGVLVALQDTWRGVVG